MAKTDLVDTITKFAGELNTAVIEKDGVLTSNERHLLSLLRRMIEKYERIADAQEELNVLKVNYNPHKEEA